MCVFVCECSADVCNVFERSVCMVFVQRPRLVICARAETHPDSLTDAAGTSQQRHQLNLFLPSQSASLRRHVWVIEDHTVRTLNVCVCIFGMHTVCEYSSDRRQTNTHVRTHRTRAQHHLISRHGAASNSCGVILYTVKCAYENAGLMILITHWLGSCTSHRMNTKHQSNSNRFSVHKQFCGLEICKCLESNDFGLPTSVQISQRLDTHVVRLQVHQYIWNVIHHE